MKAWTTYKRRLLELQDMLNRNPIQDAFIALSIEILLALLEDKINETAVCVGEVKEVDVETQWDADDIKTPPFTQGLKKIIQATERLAEKGKYCGVDDDL